MKKKRERKETFKDQKVSELLGRNSFVDKHEAADAASCLDEQLEKLHISDKPKSFSFVRAAMSKKTDRVSKYSQYKKLWEMHPVPGAKHDRSLRLHVKEKLAYQHPLTKARRVYVPNTYTVPTGKKRWALRMHIKEKLAYQPPPTKARRVYVPNTYTVPTGKKRWALRVEISNSLTNGLVPRPVINIQ